MSKDDFNFQRDLRKAIFDADPNKMDRKELVTLTFKYWVSKLFEWVLVNKGQQVLEVEAMVQVKRNLISEFRNTDLEEYQKSEKQYEDLFEKTIKEIFEEAGRAHKGEDTAKVNQSLSINPEQYIKEGGLYVPDHLKS